MAKTELATLGGGCFWCIEAPMRELQGVHAAVSGYAGGAKPNPSYEAVCSGLSGHAEVVQVSFDPTVLPYRTILEAFFTLHDPTTLNRQGADQGAQYRSVIFTHSAEQEATARALIAELTKDEVWERPIVTEVKPAPTFFAAETYHQDYYANNPLQGYCFAIVRPKLQKFRTAWQAKLKPIV